MRLDQADALHIGDRPIDRVMLGTTEVWRRIITITPQAPTFHDGDPWITLPEQEGVTYTVDGTPDYSQTVTVTATALAGYELAGTTTWEHTYGPPPRYVASGIYTSHVGESLPRSTWVTVATHTTPAGFRVGELSATTEWRFAGLNGDVRTRILVNGTQVAYVSVNGGNTFGLRQTATSASSIDLTSNSLVKFQVQSTVNTNRDFTEGNWSIS